jgi:hypothetical protein
VFPILKQEETFTQMLERGCNGYVLDVSFMLRLSMLSAALTPTENRSSSFEFQKAFKRKLRGQNTPPIV